jgi:hypothetical protein
MRRDSYRPERYSSSKRAFSSLRLCWATQSAKQLFSRALKVVSLESLLAFLTRPSLSTTVVLICSPVITMSYKNHTNIPGCPEEAALDNRVVSACTESAGCSTSQSMARGLLKQLPELDSSNGDQLARPLECPIALVRKLHHRRCDGTDVGGRRRGATLSRHSTGRRAFACPCFLPDFLDQHGSTVSILERRRAKSAIVDYVARVTKQGGKDYVPPAIGVSRK